WHGSEDGGPEGYKRAGLRVEMRLFAESNFWTPRLGGIVANDVNAVQTIDGHASGDAGVPPLSHVDIPVCCRRGRELRPERAGLFSVEVDLVVCVLACRR